VTNNACANGQKTLKTIHSFTTWKQHCKKPESHVALI